MRRLPRVLAVVCGYYLSVGLAAAHELGGSRFAAPLPLPLLLLGASGTVALTAGWLGVTDRLRADDQQWTLGTLSSRTGTLLRTFGRVAFAALVLLALGHGVFGRQVAAENLATVFVWPLWLKGLGLLAVLFGSAWRTLSPWEGLYDLLVTLEGAEPALLGDPPAWLGSWPAVVGFVFGVGVVENLTVVTRRPDLTALLVAGYGVFLVFGAVLFGREWFARADTLAVLYSLLGRVAPVRFDRTEAGGYRLRVRYPWAGCTDPVADTALVVFVVATVYTVSFDGFANTPEYQTVLFGTRALLPVGPSAGVLLYLVGLVGFVGSYALAVRAVDALAVGRGGGLSGAARAFAPTVVPIAAAYEVAHNYPFVLASLGQFLTIASDLTGGGATVALLGWLSVPVFWASQVVLVVGGHVVAVVAAHRVAVRRYGSRSRARRGHLPLVVVMVGYTILSLWIVSRPLVQ